MPATPTSPGDTRFRDHSANERTLLAWIRTGVALMALGFAIARFGLFLREMAEVATMRTAPTQSLGSAWLGVALVVLGLVTNASAVVRYGAVRKAIDEQSTGALRPTLVYVLGVGSVLVAIVMATILAVSIEN
jgi:putative membrane protein